MKKILTLALTAGLLFNATFAVKNANAVDLTINGSLSLVGQIDDYGVTKETSNSDDLGIYQRFQIDMLLAATDTIKAKLRLRVPNNAEWGNTETGIGGGEVGVRLRHAYVDWIPTDGMLMRAGLQPTGLPGYMGSDSNPLMDTDVAALTFSMQINEMIGITAQYARPYTDSESNLDNTSVNFMTLMLPIKVEGVKVTPWISYASIGKNAEPNLDNEYQFKFGQRNFATTGNEYAYWVGATSQFTIIDKLTFGADFLYNYTSFSLANKFSDTSGYLFDLYATYALDELKVGGFFWYASGDDGNDVNTMVTYANAGSWAGNLGYSLFFDGSLYGIGTSSGVTSPAGTTGFGFNVADIKVMEQAKIGAHIMYIKGTHNNNAQNTSKYTSNLLRALSSKESVIELGALATYDLTKEFQLGFALGYLLTDLESKNDRNAYSINAGMKYSF